MGKKYSSGMTSSQQYNNFLNEIIIILQALPELFAFNLKPWHCSSGLSATILLVEDPQENIKLKWPTEEYNAWSDIKQLFQPSTKTTVI